MGRKFGWHSGTLTCQDIKAKGDVYIQDDIVFSDVSAGVLGITGGIDMQSTVSAIGIDLGGTFSTTAINIDGTQPKGILVTFTDSTGGKNGIHINNTFTASAVIAHKALQVDLLYSPTAGTACPIGIAGKVTLDGDLTAANNYPGLGWGVQGQIHMANGSTINGSTYGAPGAVYAGLRGVVTDAGTSTYTKGYLCALYAEIQMAQADANNGANFNIYGIYVRNQGVATSTNMAAGIYMDSNTTGSGTNTILVGIDINNALTGIDIGSATTGIDFTGAYTRGIRLGTHDWGEGLTGIVITTTDPLLQVAGRVAASNVAAGVYACDYKQLALTSATQNTDTSWFASWNELYITPTTTTNLTGSSHYAAVKGHVEITGTVTSSTGTTASLWGSNIIPSTYINNGTIAGCTVDMILNNGYTNSGIIAAYAIGSHTDPGQNLIPIGYYMPYNACARGLLFGAPYSSGRSGLKILTDNTTWSAGATCGIYFDDGGTALTAWGEGFTVGLAVLTDSTGASQTGWPYAAFFYNDIRANITSASTQHWATVMMNTAIASGKTVDGFTSHGLSTLHLSCDINGTLASNNTMSNLSFGGNSTGTVDGDWVCMHVRDTTGDFSALLKLDTNATGCYTTSYAGTGTFDPNAKGTFTQAGQIRILIGGDTYYIPYGTVA